MNRLRWLLMAALTAAAAAGLWYAYRAGGSAPAPATAVPPGATSAPAAAVASAPPAAPPPPADPLARGDVAAAIDALVGAKTVARYLQMEDFPRRLVATVDNLGRAHAPPAMWPVHPTPDRFLVDESAGHPVIAGDNAGRYTPLVLLAETLDMGGAAQLYLRMYPLLQQEYRQLGYPDREFHRRLLEVIDQLLATPEPDRPLRLQLTEVKGPIPSVRPWVRYEYADPALEQLSAGQKILLRVGIVNERRLKKKLAELREEILKGAAAR